MRMRPILALTFLLSGCLFTDTEKYGYAVMVTDFDTHQHKPLSIFSTTREIWESQCMGILIVPAMAFDVAFSPLKILYGAATYPFAKEPQTVTADEVSFERE